MAAGKVEKKRKRDSDRQERPSKKFALEVQSLPRLAASIVEDDSELAPAVVTTPGVNLPRDLRLKPYLKSRPKGDGSTVYASLRNKGIVGSEMLLQSSDHPKLDFVGREAEENADAQLKHYVAVVDPEKGSWEFVEVRKLTLRSGIKGTKSAVEEEGEEDEDEEASKEANTIQAQRTALTNTFGTKQSRKAAQSMAENTQLSNVPAGVANAAESAILSSMPAHSAADIASKAASVQAEVQATKPVPPANLDATHPSDVYPIDVLVPNGLSTLLQLPGITEWQDAITSGHCVLTTSRYVSHRVEAVVKSGNNTQLQILRFILLMLEFARALRSTGKKSANTAASGPPPGSKRLPPREELRRILSSTTGVGKNSANDSNNNNNTDRLVPDSVIDAIRCKFAPHGSYLLKNDVTFLHTTLCALSLHIPPQPAKDGGTSSQGGNTANELATDPADLRDDLRLDAATVQQYFRELGCRYDKPRESEFAKWGIRGGKAEANQRRVARLRLPLQFPKVSRGGGRR